MIDGILLLDKPEGPTTARCVRELSRRIGVKGGHAGTLDPMATGLIVVLLGRATKISPFLSSLNKRYTGRVRLGIRTSTGDREGEPIEEKPVDVDGERLVEIAETLRGDMELRVPIYSAVKHHGKPLYKYARRGEDVVPPTRRMRIDDFSITDMDLPEFSFDTVVSKGTYIRSLAEHIGEVAGCGAHLIELRRTAVGRFRIEDAVPLSDAMELQASGDIKNRIVDPLEALSHMPNVEVDADRMGEITMGRFPMLDIDKIEFGCIFTASYDGKLIAVLKKSDNTERAYSFERVFVRPEEIEN